MKRIFLFLLFVIAFFSSRAQVSSLRNMPVLSLPWKTAELLEPADLHSAIIKGNAPIIFNIGVVENIPGAKRIGAAGEPANLTKLKKALSTFQKDKTVVIYCGCCPFGKCPNIIPAYQALKDGGFTKIKVLNLPMNLKTNWIAKGYAVENLYK